MGFNYSSDGFERWPPGFENVIYENDAVEMSLLESVWIKNSVKKGVYL